MTSVKAAVRKEKPCEVVANVAIHSFMMLQANCILSNMPKLPNVNIDWFKSMLKRRGLTQTAFAERLEVPRTAVTKMLDGSRRISSEEAARISKLLLVPIEEVMQNAGIKVSAAAGGSDIMSVSGYVDGNLTVHRGSSARGPQTVPRPSFGNHKSLRCMRFQTSGSSRKGLENMDGALIYFDDVLQNIDTNGIGKLCVVRVAETKVWSLAVVKNGYTHGTFNLHCLSGDLMQDSAILDTMCTVIWLKF